MENKFDTEIVKNDLRMFFDEMKVPEDRIKKFLEADGVVDGFVEMFNAGELKLNEENCLEFTTSDGQTLTLRPKRPKMSDLNTIKPHGYDSMDSERKQLVKVSFLTGKTFRELESDFYASDLELPKMFCSFL